MAKTHPFKIEAPYYPIVYVRGYAATPGEREDTFHDAYYGFAATSVEKRQAAPPAYFAADVFEGLLIRLMKADGYVDASNEGVKLAQSNPSRAIWVCRFYDDDYFQDRIYPIEDHAETLREMIVERIPRELENAGVDLGAGRSDYKVVLIAHSMGGLVCRTLIQNLWPTGQKRPGKDYTHLTPPSVQDPTRWVHRFVTLGTPHKGIDLGRIPGALQKIVMNQLNPFDSAMFGEDRMREYLKLPDKSYDVHSLGTSGFPVKRCLCLVGSDHGSYGAVQHVTGGHSDGLVKQDRAYVVAGPRPAAKTDYSDAAKPYWANVHRAHSGRRGIVNSYESYENLRRFLFGDTKAEVLLNDLTPSNQPVADSTYLYDIEFTLSVRDTGVYLHRRQQEPCENAMRYVRAELPKSITLHTVFLDRKLRRKANKFSHFGFTLRINERRVGKGMLWDHEYPVRPIFVETIEVRVDDQAQVQYRWLSDGDAWLSATEANEGEYEFKLRPGGAVSGTLLLRADRWPYAY